MANLYLWCNFPKCSKLLCEWASVTKCYHIFCSDHELNSSCPVCGQYLNDNLSLITVNLNPNESYKNMVLAGLSPEIIIDIASRGIRFWTYQIYHERAQYEQRLKSSNERESNLQEYCNALKSNFQVKKQKFDRTVEDLQKELDTFRQNEENYCKQISDKGRLVSQLQNEIDSLRKQVLKKNIKAVVPDEANGNYNLQKQSFGQFIRPVYDSSDVMDNEIKNQKPASPLPQRINLRSPFPIRSPRLMDNTSPFPRQNHDYYYAKTGLDGDEIREQSKESRVRLF